MGMYNSSSIFKMKNKYFVKPSTSNFCFTQFGRDNYCYLTANEDENLMKIQSKGNHKSISIANGFIKVAFGGQEVKTQGSIDFQGGFHIVQKSENYAKVKNFSLHKLEVWTIDSLNAVYNQDNSKNLLSDIKSLMNGGYEIPETLTYYRDN